MSGRALKSCLYSPLRLVYGLTLWYELEARASLQFTDAWLAGDQIADDKTIEVDKNIIIP